MNRQKKGGFWRFLALMAVLVLTAVAALMALAALESGAVKQAELDEALEKSRLERSVLLLADEKQKQILLQEQTDRQLEEQQRQLLQEDFLRRNKEVLLMLVNPWNMLPEDYEPHLTDIGDGMFFDERAAGPLAHMLADAKKEGIIAVPISGYRTREYQQGLFDDKVLRVRANGFSEEDAPEEAAKEVAVPGTSEHQLGLAMDILDVNNPNLDWTQEWAPAQRWLMEHCSEYGFILRFPNGTEEQTGIIYEPWHYRYVGLSAAKEITKTGVTLEEYLGTVQK